MKRLILVRGHDGLGVLYCADKRLHSLERPWLPDAPGGTPSLSCVPAGTYKLIAHSRPNGDDVLALVNPGLGVYYLPQDRPHKVGRFLILIHPANYVDEIEGCIAPGMGRSLHETKGPMVTDSRTAMREIMMYGPQEIEIVGHNDWVAS